MTDTPDTLDLDALAAWCRNYTLAAWCRGAPKGELGPNDLMRPPWHLTRNAACGALEALEARSVLERIPGQAGAWKLAPAPPQPSRGYSLPLSPAEHAALLRLLDQIEPSPTATGQQVQYLSLRGLDDLRSLRRLRSRLLRKDAP